VSAPNESAAAPARASGADDALQNAHDTAELGVAQAGAFAVLAARHDRRERLWSRYPTKAEAQAAADRLTALGIPARVEPA